MIEPWSDTEREAALTVFEKMARNNTAWLTARRNGTPLTEYPMPHDLYEAHRLTMKSVSSEIGVFDEQNRILLIKRPSLNEDPAEPYPDLWHVPGTRHIGDETEQEALERLLTDEVGTAAETRFIGHKEYHTNGRTGLSFLYIARLPSHSLATNEKSGWFETHALPSETLAEHVPIIEFLASEQSQ